jgi:TRAP-type C4-dicarboxylate transport system permease small subunit
MEDFFHPTTVFWSYSFMDRFIEKLERVHIWVTASLVAVLMFCVTIQVFVRYVLQKPLFLWSEELARFILVWTVFLGIGYGIKHKTHFAMDILPGLMGRHVGKAATIFADLCMGLILILLLLGGLHFSYFGLFQRSPNMEILMFFIFISLPIGGVLSFIYLVWRFTKDLRERPKA